MIVRMESSELGTKRPVPAALQPRLVDWATDSWPVHERYERRREADPLTGAERMRLFPAGRARRVQVADDRDSYSPHVDPTNKGLFVLLQPLATGTDAVIAKWVEEHGLIGVHPATPSRGETTAEIREAVSHLTACVLALDAGQHDPSKLRAALHLLQQPIGRYLDVRAVITQADGRARLLPLIASRGYLAAAYQRLLGSGSVEDHVTRALYHWRQPRQCDRCGEWFRPRRRDSRYHSGNCRKRAWESRQG